MIKNTNWVCNGAASVENRCYLDPSYVTGFCDAEGSFIVKLSKNKTGSLGWRVQLNFAIGLHKRDEKVLMRIRIHLGNIGTVRKRKDACFFSVTSLDDILLKVIPHFDQYPLITQKKADFLFFKQVAFMIKQKKHLTEAGLKDIINIRASINRGLTLGLKKAFPLCKPVDRPIINNQKIYSPNWVAGFTSGDGCFFLKFGISKNHPNRKPQVRLGFSITQDIRDELFIKMLVPYFNCGSVSYDRGCINFTVTRFYDIYEKMIPFFHKYDIIGVKYYQFKIWCEVAELMKDKKHLTAEGLLRISKLKREWSIVLSSEE